MPRRRSKANVEFKDYYKVLGVSEDANQDDIRKQYRRLARKYHPDVSEASDAEERFKEVSEAYEVLRDEEKRREYDALRSSGWRGGEEFTPPPGWQGAGFGGFRDAGGFSDGGGFSEFFETLFGGLGGARRAGPRGGGFRAGAARGADARARIELDLETAYQGGTRRVSLNGAEGPRTLDIQVPKGVRDGQTIRLKGQGSPGPAGKGDLLLEIRLKPHRLFRLEGRDVHLTLPVAPWEAALGATVNVPTLEGEVKLKIPPGSNSGKRLRLKGRGLPGKPPGDQLVELQVVTPKAETGDQEAAYRKMAESFDFDPRSGFGGK